MFAVSMALAVVAEVNSYNPTADENCHEMTITETRFSKDKYIQYYVKDLPVVCAHSGTSQYSQRVSFFVV